MTKEQPIANKKPIKHTVNGDEKNGWYCYACNFFSISATLAAEHDGVYETDNPTAPSPPTKLP